MRLIIGNVQTPANPLLRAVSLIVGVALLVVALFFGAVLFAFVIGLGVILAAIAMVRFWWIGRQLRRAAGSARFRDARSQEAPGHRIIEGEYTDVSEAHDERRRRESR